MKSLYITIVFLSISFSLSAQYTEVINSKRPGFSESPFGVGTGVYQLEGGIFYQNSNDLTLASLQKSMGSDMFLRTGLFFEKLEFNLNLKYQKDEFLTELDPHSTNKTSGISQFTLGAKYLIFMPEYKDPSKEIRSWRKKMAFDKKRLIPSVGLYAGLNTNFLGKSYKLPQLSPKVAILLQNDFSDYLIWVNNLVGDNLTLSDHRTLGYISTLSYSITDRFSIFGENQGMFSSGKKDFKLGGGFAYLFTTDLQIGTNIHWDMQFAHLNLFAGLGASWRIDRHVNKPIYKKTDQKGSGKIQQKKEGFLKNIFKKNKRSKRK